MIKCRIHFHGNSLPSPFQSGTRDDTTHQRSLNSIRCAVNREEENLSYEM